MGILIRLCKVIYVLTVLTGLVLGCIAFHDYMPRTLISYRELVHCANGKSFYVDSKPIYPKDGYSEYSAPANVREREITSECQFGTSYYIGWGVNLDMKNHTEEKVPQYQQTGSWSISITEFVVIFGAISLFAEIVKRVLRYIFFGKNFFSLK